jgi:hypothetical protein
MANYGVFRNPVITIETVSYTGELTEARLVPNTPKQTMKTLDPSVVLQDVDTPDWTLTLTGVQGDLSETLQDAVAGSELDVVLQAKSGTGNRKATFTVLAEPVEFGGEQGSYATFTIELSVLDQPVWGTSA